jgi:hypothetical protein
MLHKQDKLVTLEEELDRIDREEPRVLFLGNRRRDKNEERKNVLDEIDRELQSYGMPHPLLHSHVHCANAEIVFLRYLGEEKR